MRTFKVQITLNSNETITVEYEFIETEIDRLLPAFLERNLKNNFLCVFDNNSNKYVAFPASNILNLAIIS